MNRNAGEICFIAKREGRGKVELGFIQTVGSALSCVSLFTFSYFEALTINVVVMRQEAA